MQYRVGVSGRFSLLSPSRSPRVSTSPSPRPSHRRGGDWANLLKRVSGVDMKKGRRSETGRLLLPPVSRNPNAVQALNAALLESKELDPRRPPTNDREPLNASRISSDDNEQLTRASEHAA